MKFTNFLICLLLSGNLMASEIMPTVEPAKVEDIHVCFVSDEGYVRPTCTAMASVLYNSAASEFIHFHIIDTGIKDESKSKFNKLNETLKPCEIEFYKFGEEKLEVFNRKDTRYWPRNIFCRYFIPEIWPELGKALYLDGDLCALKNIRSLWDNDVSEYYMGAVLDEGINLNAALSKYSSSIGIDPSKYVQSAVLLMNTKKMREDDITKKLVDFTINSKFNYMMFDQDVLNLVVGSKTKVLDQKYNVQMHVDYSKGSVFFPEFFKRAYEAYLDPTLIHYCGLNKPWKISCESVPSDSLVKYYFAYEDLTPFAKPVDVLEKLKLKVLRITNGGKI